MTKRKRILKQLYDVKPLKTDGFLDLEKIRNADRIVRIDKKYFSGKKVAYRKMRDVAKSGNFIRENYPLPKKSEPKFKKNVFPRKAEPRRPNIVHLGKTVPEEILSISRVYEPIVFSNRKIEKPDKFKEYSVEKYQIQADYDILKEPAEKKKNIASDFFEQAGSIPQFQFIKPENARKKKKRTRRPKSHIPGIFSGANSFNARFSPSLGFIATILIFSMIIPSFGLIQKGLETKELISGSEKNVLGEFAQAQDNLSAGRFDKASLNFEQSCEILKNTNDEVSKIGGSFSQLLRFVPGISKIATASYVLSAGENISLAGKIMTDSLKSLANLENPFASETDISLAELFLKLREGMQEATDKLKMANDALEKSNMEDLPSEMRPKLLELKEKLPVVLSSLESFSENSSIILDVLGYNGQRKFLFLFQNNQEMRATGGFIGSYGILDISEGRIKNLFVDDIYNPDGQLTAKVIPPEPIQKMSAVWTMHDANWFPDFPTSAEKVAWFYEKTGGPTVDGVIAMSPDVIEKMLSATGPIEMPEYGATVDTDNFREVAQYEVEVDFDKEQNQPKKFIADLTPKILDKLLNNKSPGMMLKAIEILGSALKEKHILIYSKNYNVQKIISNQGWSGEVLAASKDYLAVINSNINGYKTDGVIDESIEHKAEIGEDGGITDEVTVTRKHNGGNEKYDWWNKVNVDYMRVYVPEGSKLIEASGQTREFVSPPLDYQSLQFRRDPLIEQIEEGTEIDEATGTRIYVEKKKTVFANWVYVSPGETVVLKYKYRLPFKLAFDDLHHPADSFSILYQKQSGSPGSGLVSKIALPESQKIIWKYPDTLEILNNQITLKTRLETDKFIGFAAQKRL